MVENWHRRHAIQIVAQLPSTSNEDALIVLDLAKSLVEGFLSGGDQARDLDRGGAVVAFPASTSSR